MFSLPSIDLLDRVVDQPIDSRKDARQLGGPWIMVIVLAPPVIKTDRALPGESMYQSVLVAVPGGCNRCGLMRCGVRRGEPLSDLPIAMTDYRDTRITGDRASCAVRRPAPAANAAAPHPFSPAADRPCRGADWSRACRRCAQRSPSRANSFQNHPGSARVWSKKFCSTYLGMCAQ